jgi:hypothetical protein
MTENLKSLLIIRMTKRAWNEDKKAFVSTMKVVEDFNTAAEAETRLHELKLLDPKADYRIVRNDGTLG